MPEDKLFLISQSRLQNIQNFVSNFKSSHSINEIEMAMNLFYNLDEAPKKEKQKPKVLPKEAKA